MKSNTGKCLHVPLWDRAYSLCPKMEEATFQGEGFFSFCRNFIPPPPADPPQATPMPQRLAPSSKLQPCTNLIIISRTDRIQTFLRKLILLLLDSYPNREVHPTCCLLLPQKARDSSTFVWAENWHPLCAQIPLFAPWKDEWNTTDSFPVGREREWNAQNLANVLQCSDWVS